MAVSLAPLQSRRRRRRWAEPVCGSMREQLSQKQSRSDLRRQKRAAPRIVISRVNIADHLARLSPRAPAGATALGWTDRDAFEAADVHLVAPIEQLAACR